MFSENDFKVLNQIRLTQGGASQRELSKCLGLSLGTINKTVRTLEDQGLIQNGSISAAGFEALHPYKVENAIIMAAGLSSRFAPISYEKPKGCSRCAAKSSSNAKSGN